MPTCPRTARPAADRPDASSQGHNARHPSVLSRSHRAAPSATSRGLSKRNHGTAWIATRLSLKLRRRTLPPVLGCLFLCSELVGFLRCQVYCLSMMRVQLRLIVCNEIGNFFYKYCTVRNSNFLIRAWRSVL